MIKDKKRFSFEISRALLILIIAGVFVGTLKKYDFIIAVIIAIKIAYDIYKEILKSKTNKNGLLFAGMIITCLGGIIGETFGVSNGYWVYHEVSSEIPIWVPFAWMYAFYFLYKLERKLIPLLVHQTQKNKIILATILALILPAFGEIITIQLGVWTYYWPYQVFGVPLYAFLCLLFVHMSVYVILHFACKKYNISDIVYN